MRGRPSACLASRCRKMSSAERVKCLGNVDPAASHVAEAWAERSRHAPFDSARGRKSLQRGGDRDRAEFDPAHLADPERSDEVLAVDEALAGLAAADPQAAELVKLRYFVGLSVPDAAATLNLSPRTAERLWTYARAWLRRAMSDDCPA